MRYDGDYEELLRLDNGAEITLRALRDTDAPLLAAGFAELSPDTRRQRFHFAKNALTAAELVRLTACDGITQYAILALDAAGTAIAVARWARDAIDSTQAELAIVVTDAWQGQGLGWELLQRLRAAAGERGIERLTAVLLPENTRMIALLKRMGARYGRDEDAQLIEFELSVALDPDGGPL